MSANQINISYLVPEVLTQLTHGACIMTQLSTEYNFTTSEKRSINWCCMSNCILFIIDISNHQVNHLQQSSTDKVTNFILIHYLNFPRENHATTLEWRTWIEEMITLCGENKKNLRKPLGKWSIDDNKCRTSWKWFLSRDLHTLYYREYET